jgi:peptidoglycan/LPS O-acetylase OafA/YrhL
MRIAKRLTPVLAVLVVLALVVPALAQTGGAYDLTWSTIDGGGGQATGGDYSLAGTLGQPDAGHMSSGPYEIGGGFWSTFGEVVYRIFLPLVLRNNP